MSKCRERERDKNSLNVRAKASSKLRLMMTESIWETIEKWSWLHFSHCSLLVGLLSSTTWWKVRLWWRPTMTFQKSSAVLRRRVQIRIVSCWVVEAMNSTTRSLLAANYKDHCHLSMWVSNYHQVLVAN